jgi:hypothetical protein
MGFRVQEIQATPNPNAAKFVLDREIAAQPSSFFSAAQAADHPLASRLMAIPGVSSVLLLGDFVTINKSPDAKWDRIKPGVEAVLAGAD